MFAMTSLGFENYAEALKIYLSKYREVSSEAWYLLASSYLPYYRRNQQGERTDLEAKGLGQLLLAQEVTQLREHSLVVMVPTTSLVDNNSQKVPSMTTALTVASTVLQVVTMVLLEVTVTKRQINNDSSLYNAGLNLTLGARCIRCLLRSRSVLIIGFGWVWGKEGSPRYQSVVYMWARIKSISTFSFFLL